MDDAEVDLQGATGVQVGDQTQMYIHLRSGCPPWWTKSGYIEKVRDTALGGGAQGGLKDRDDELAELAASAPVITVTYGGKPSLGG